MSQKVRPHKRNPYPVTTNLELIMMTDEQLVSAFAADLWSVHPTLAARVPAKLPIAKILKELSKGPEVSSTKFLNTYGSALREALSEGVQSPTWQRLRPDIVAGVDKIQTRADAVKARFAAVEVLRALTSPIDMMIYMAARSALISMVDGYLDWPSTAPNYSK